jgi:hypothetical protein
MKYSRLLYAARLQIILAFIFSIPAPVFAASCVIQDDGLNYGGMVMDFETLTPPITDSTYPGYSQLGPTCTAFGDEFSATAYISGGTFVKWGLISPNYTGSEALFLNFSGGTTILDTGYPDLIFDLLSIDLSELVNQSSYISTSVVFMAEVYSTGETISHTVTLDGSFGMETFSFGDKFLAVSKVWWEQTPEWHQFDNIVIDNILNPVITAIPIPPALWLFGTGLLGLIGVARKKVA